MFLTSEINKLHIQVTKIHHTTSYHQRIKHRPRRPVIYPAGSLPFLYLNSNHFVDLLQVEGHSTMIRLKCPVKSLIYYQRYHTVQKQSKYLHAQSTKESGQPGVQDGQFSVHLHLGEVHVSADVTVVALLC